MTYYAAILIEHGVWAETFGDHDKECVDVEIEEWHNSPSFNRKHCVIVRKAFPRIPTQAQLSEWACGCARVK